MGAGRTWSPPTRRAFLLRGSAALAVAGWAPGLWTPARARSLQLTAAQVVDGSGTTLESTIVRIGSGPYFELSGGGPGFPIVTREDLSPLQAGREDRRIPLASIVHLTDIHIIDSQSPARVEFTDRHADPPADDLPIVGAYRAQETLTTHVGASMVTRVNQIARGPVTGRPFDCAVSTGDNIDNFQANEARMFFEVLDGLRVDPNSGSPDRYEGVQDHDFFDPAYWHPDPGPADNYKSTFGFPDHPGLLDAAIVAFDSPGLQVPWYSTYGNHDGLLQGNSPTNPTLEAIATGPLKVINRGPGTGFFNDPESLANALDPAAVGTTVRPVTPDPERATISPGQWVQAHLDSPSAPSGHGYTSDAVTSGLLYYTFPVATGVLGISLDTVNRGGYADGSLTAGQFAWLQDQLTGAHTSYIDDQGNRVANPGGADQLVILFSHHNLFTLNNPFPDPTDPLPKVTGDEIRALLHRFPNVIAWINGHSHVNRITPFADPAGLTGGFWEISTAAHVDHPQQARLVEVVDNDDGTLSIFCTIIEHAAAADPEAETDPTLRLASISRELAANEIQTGGNPDAGLGSATDLNVELSLVKPFSLPPAVPGQVTTTTIPATDADAGGGTAMPATGGQGLATTGTLAAAALGAAVAVRTRRSG